MGFCNPSGVDSANNNCRKYRGDALAILTPQEFIVTEIRYRKHQILVVMRQPKALAFNCLVL